MIVLQYLFPAWFSARNFDRWTKIYIEERRSEKGFWSNFDLFLLKILLYGISLFSILDGFVALSVCIAVLPQVSFKILLVALFLLWGLVPLVALLFRYATIWMDELQKRGERWLRAHSFIR